MPVWSLLVWLLIGGAAGYLAGNILGAHRPWGVIGDIVIGILGSIAGGWILGLLGASGSGGIVSSFITAFIGALLLLWLIRKINTV